MLNTCAAKAACLRHMGGQGGMLDILGDQGGMLKISQILDMYGKEWPDPRLVSTYSLSPSEISPVYYNFMNIFNLLPPLSKRMA